ncbi:MAG: hypothetical protein ABIF10_03465 [Candidatus Woesearchaeota archaeon]
MTSFEIHTKKYELFRKDAENKENSDMTRINAYFEACFHLIEACAAIRDIHINKHQEVRKASEQYDIFGEKTRDMWNRFQELENRIRPAQSYGGRINGEQLAKAKAIATEIFCTCEPIIDGFRKEKSTKSTEKGLSHKPEHENAEGL